VTDNDDDDDDERPRPVRTEAAILLLV